MEPPQGRRRRETTGGRIEKLTAMELEVLKLLAYGATDRALAETLGLTIGVIRRRKASIYRKLGVSRKVDAARIALSQGLV